MKRGLVCAGAALAVGLSGAVEAKTLRWAPQGDAATMDPHSHNAGPTTNIVDQIYEALLQRDPQLKILPQLATEYQSTSPTTWRFKLRPGVKFHNGAAFNADDVVFSVERAMADSSQFKTFTNSVVRAVKIDDLTVDIVTDKPNPLIPAQFTEVRIMDKEWSEANNATKPQNFNAREETFTVRNANGTGPFVLGSRQPDVRTVLTRNADWWGWKDLPRSNVTEVVVTPIANAATRLAALLSGEIDATPNVPVQDVERLRRSQGVKLLQTNEVRVIFLGFDMGRSELLYSDVKGKNPFADLNVRRAVAYAVDVEAIRTRVMRGLSVNTWQMISPGVAQFDASLDAIRPKANIAEAKRYMEAAGYPNGFSVTMDCPNNRYINDEQICQAVVGMLAQIGIRVTLNAMPLATYFPKIGNKDTSFFLLGWGVPTYDAHYTLQLLLQTADGTANGQWNYTGYSNARFDALVNRMTTELDTKARDAMAKEALQIAQNDLPYIPLHHQVLVWGLRQTVDMPITPSNQPRFQWTSIR
jgi:peptide/nickel transport system substrate-binding protein